MIRNATPTVAVVRLPGMNCEDETVRALAAAGLSTALVGWDADPSALVGFAAYVLPGGFSYQDRVRAGATTRQHPRGAGDAGPAPIRRGGRRTGRVRDGRPRQRRRARRWRARGARPPHPARDTARRAQPGRRRVVASAARDLTQPL